MAVAMGWHKPEDVAGSSAPAIMVGLFVAMGGMLFGTTGTINGILAMDAFKERFSPGFMDSNNAKDMNTAQVSVIVAMLSAGAVVGALLSAPVGDIYGRRRSLIGAVGVFSFGVMFQVCATNVSVLVVGRTLTGIGVGVVSVLVPLYQSETAPKWIRGTLVCAYQLSITIGLFIAAVVNILTYRIASAASYRIPTGLQLIWACVLAVGLSVLPETPRYLVKSGQKAAAALSLSRLRRLDITHPALQDELAEIEANHQYELRLGPDTYKEVFCGQPRLGRRTSTGCFLQMLQQLTGVNFIIYYGTAFFNGAGISDPFKISLIMQVINMVSTIPGLLVVESWGRRKLLVVGSLGMAASQLFIATYATATGSGDRTTQNQILLIFVSIFLFCFAASWGPVTWVVTSEIYPLKVRAKSMSISTASNWLLNFAIAYGTPYMVGNGEGSGDMGSKVFFVWGAFCLMSAAFVWLFVFETSKISLEQIDEMYERVEHAWKSRGFEPMWSFQQIRDLGFFDSGIPAAEARLELQHTNSIVSTGTSQSEPGVAGAVDTEGNKTIPSLGRVDFGY